MTLNIAGILQERLSFFEKIESLIYDCHLRRQDHDTLQLAVFAATFASMFHTGAFTSAVIEKALIQIGESHKAQQSNPKPGSILHVMTTAANAGGHTRVVENWINFAAGNQTHSLLLTSQVPGMTIPSELYKNIIKASGKLYILRNESLISKALKLREIASQYETVVLHVHMYDVVPNIAFSVEEFKRPILYYNHADHVFGLGIAVSDVVVDISMRGNEISSTKRGINDRVILPVPVDMPTRNTNRLNCRKRLNIQHDKKLILSIGSPFKYRPTGEFNFPKMAQSLVSKSDDYVFYIVGPSGGELWWKSILCHSQSKIITKGWVPHEDLFDYYSSADLYIDGFPVGGATACIEAIVSGISLITVDNGLTQFDFAKHYQVEKSNVVASAIAFLSGIQNNSYDSALKTIDMHLKNNWMSQYEMVLQQLPSRHRVRHVNGVKREFSIFDKRLAEVDLNFVKFNPFEILACNHLEATNTRRLKSILENAKCFERNNNNKQVFEIEQPCSNNSRPKQKNNIVINESLNTDINHGIKKQQFESNEAKLIAFYLPQFHPIPENDRWWGKGFTEWTKVSKAQPLFSDHYQPHRPGELGFYDLRLPEVRMAQAELARAYGIYGFCYYHYWFNGKQLLERPLQEVIKSGSPDFPFCLCWANENWTRTWDGGDNQILIQQKYCKNDDQEHIRYLCDIFSDRRYIRIKGKPLFLVYRTKQFPNPLETTMLWREEAHKQGVGEIFLCRVESFSDEHDDPKLLGFDAAVEFQPDWSLLTRELRDERLPGLTAFRFGKVVDKMLQKKSPPYKRFPCVTPSWDNTARRKERAVIFTESSPAEYRRWLRAVIEKLKDSGEEDKLVFINAWNEWGEGNHLEPDERFIRTYLEETKSVLDGIRIEERSTILEDYGEAQQPEGAENRFVFGGQPLEAKSGAGNSKNLKNITHRAKASIIIPVCNKVAYTQKCIETLLKNTPSHLYELIIVDNASDDGSAGYLRSLGDSVIVITNDKNNGFAIACNQGAERASGEYIVFLNNDTEPQQGWLANLLNTVESDPQVGAVGAKLIYPSGRIQEAGGIIFSDGSGWNFGNGDIASKDIYNRPCEVDYCSGACLLVRHDLFISLGGFDERYSPAYYEETDLCFGLRKLGFKVVYRPDAVVIHNESITAGSGCFSFKRYLDINRQKFVDKWKQELSSQPPSPKVTGLSPVTADRGSRKGNSCNYSPTPAKVYRNGLGKKKVLIFFPHNPCPPKTGAHQRCLSMLNSFSQMGFDVTLASATMFSDSPWTSDSIASLQRTYGVQVHLYQSADVDRTAGRHDGSKSPSNIDWDLYAPPGLKDDFRRCFKRFEPDIVMINYAYWAELSSGEEFARALRLIDTHDLVTLNLKMRRKLCEYLSANPIDPAVMDEHFFSGIEASGSAEEYQIFDRFDHTISISASETQLIKDNTHLTNVTHIPMTIDPIFLNNNYCSNPLFVVGNNPFNLQGYFYFITKVLPGIRKQIKNFVLKVAGYGSSCWPPVAGVQIVGPVADLKPLYADASFAVCPMIGTTGQQIKIVEAMAHGLPVVALRNAAMHSPIEHGVSGFIAEDAESFAGWTSFLYQRREICREMGAHARETIRKNFSEGRLRSQLLDITSTRGRLKSERAADRLGRGITAATTRCQSPPERIVMLRTDAIGDTILAAGMIEPVRKKYPNAWLSVVCQEHVAEIYESCPYVDEVVGFNRGKLAKNDSYRQQLLNSLNRGVPTLLLNSVFSRDGIADWLAMGIQAPEKVAHWGDLCNISAELRLQNNHCYTRLVSERVDSASELQRHRDFLSACGIDATSLKPTLWLTQEDEIFADRFFVEKQLDASRTIALFIGAQHSIRIYPFYGKALSRVCKDEHLNVIAFGSSSEAELNSTCLAEIGVNVINLCGKTSLRQTAALLKRCRLGVGAETGTAHMACAVGTPHVVVIGGGHFGRFMPYSPLTHLVCLPLECFGCNWRCRYPKPLCIWGIDPAVLEQAVGAALELNTTGPHVFTPRREDWNPPAGGPIWKWPPSNYTGDCMVVPIFGANRNNDKGCRKHGQASQTAV